MDKKIIKVQKEIVENHLANNSLLLKKYFTGSIGDGGFDPVTFSAGYDLVGLVNCDQYAFLPHFEFNVGTSYGVSIPNESMSEETIYYERDRIRLKLKAKNNGKLVEVAFPSVKDLFYLRNLASEGQLLSVIEVNEADRDVVPIEGSQISAGFYFRASSTSYGQLVAVMNIDHPAAEELIKRYLKTIDKKFDDYRGLEQHFREKDDLGNVLWEDENLQSKEYNKERKKLHKGLFGELTNVLKQGNLEYRIA